MLSPPSDLFASFELLRRQMDELLGISGLPTAIRSTAAGALPAVNVGRTSTSVEVYAFAPGLDPGKTEVSLDRGLLRISGERPSAIADDKPNVSVYARERGAGTFVRTISLPDDVDDVDPGHVNATYRDGVLQISIARRESEQPKRITVQ
jgi:HSP20 family protein